VRALVVHNLVSLDGVPAFERASESPLRLLGAPRTWEGSGNVLLRYGVG
jgi:hypothetical protein